MLDKDRFLIAAAMLLSEDGENTEYDRAICELVCDTVGVSMEAKDVVLADLRRLATLTDENTRSILFP
ncbi:MAG: hypothetical protein ACWGQW_02320 [bacterium]